MRKIYLFLAGALFPALPVASQNGPTRTANDPEIIFHQDFEVKGDLTAEQAWQQWLDTPVGVIDEIEYYSKIGKGSVSGVNIYTDNPEDYKIFAVRTDSVIVLKNGVESSTSSKDSAIVPFPYKDDKSSIVSDASVERSSAFAEYGEDGGQYYFRYASADAHTANGYSNSTKSVEKHRRNLYIRGFDIDDQTSYRLTIFIRTRKTAKNNPIFYADLMRGYHHQRETFSTGIKGERFSYTKSDFVDGEWEKMTLMSYYLNDSIADAFVYNKSYSWYEDWEWRPTDEQLNAWGKTLNEGDTLRYIKQPDKYFIRLSFATDSVEYSIDNITLTKSWIGGIQHTGDLLRVDFGYETNLKDLAKAAKEKTRIAAVELPGDYFTVWGLKSGSWKKIGINSAEYHDDGYMYMWTKPGAGGQQIKFESFDSVLVSFTNPQADSIMLKYTGSLYPNALDEAWVNAGKKVFDFSNEVSTPNPNIKENVYSMKNLPPVFQGTKYEDGSFGLPDTITRITLNLSRKIVFNPDEDGSGHNTAFCQVFKDGNQVEIWPVSESTDTYTTFVRKNTSTPLAGDYTFKFVQLKGAATALGDDIVLNYHFGDFSKTVAAVIQIDSDWRGELPSFTTSNKGCNPASTYIHDADDASTFRKGINSDSNRAKSRLYSLNYPAGNPDNCGYILITRSSTASSAPKDGLTSNLYTIVHFDQAGDCKIQFKVTGWSADKPGSLPNIPVYLYFYPKPVQELEDGNDKGFAVLESCDKTELGSITPKTFAWYKDVEDVGTGVWPDGVETAKFNFNVPKAGDYVFEWVTKMGNKNGVMIGNYSISSANAGDLSTKYVKKINDAYDKAAAKKKEIDESTRKYKGDIYEALVAYMSTFKENAFKETAPSIYDANAAAMNDAVNVMQARMDTVDLFYTALAAVDSTLAADKKDFENVDAYKTLALLKSAADEYDCSRYDSKTVWGAAELLKAGIENMDKRIAETQGYDALLKSTKAVLDSAYVVFADEPKLEGKDLHEYDALKQAYESALAQKDNLATLHDSDLFNLYEGMVDSTKAYLFGMDAVVAYTRQVRELFKLAESLGYDFGGNKDYAKAMITSLRTQSPSWENVLREAVKLQIYKKYAAGEKFADSLDVSALVPNYYMYTVATVENDMRQKSDGTWVFKSSPNTTGIPGWTIKFGGSSAISYPGFVARDMTTEDGRIFVAGVHFDKNTTGTASTSIEGLPAAYYIAGMDMNLNNISKTEFKATVEKTEKKLTAPAKSTSRKAYYVDSVKVVEGKALTVSYEITGVSSSGAANVIGVSLLLRNPDTSVDYAALVTAQEAKLADLITFAAPVVAAEPVAVQYYNLNGVRVLAPEAGKVVIRRTILSNGKSVAEKILVK